MGQDTIYICAYSDEALREIVYDIQNGLCPNVGENATFTYQDYPYPYYDVLPASHVYLFLSISDDNIYVHTGTRFNSDDGPMFDWINLIDDDARCEGDYFHDTSDMIEFDITEFQESPDSQDDESDESEEPEDKPTDPLREV